MRLILTDFRSCVVSFARGRTASDIINIPAELLVPVCTARLGVYICTKFGRISFVPPFDQAKGECVFAREYLREIFMHVLKLWLFLCERSTRGVARLGILCRITTFPTSPRTYIADGEW